MNIGELAKETGETARNIRYLISMDVIPAPRGTRSMPEYGADHVEAIRRYQRLKNAGYKISAIKLLLDSGEPARIPVADGVTLMLDHSISGVSLDIDRIARQVADALTNFVKETNHAQHDRHEQE